MLVQPDVANSAEVPPDDCTRKRTKEFRYGSRLTSSNYGDVCSKLLFIFCFIFSRNISINWQRITMCLFDVS